MSTVTPRRRWPWIAGAAIIGAALAGWWYFGTSRNQEAKGAARPSSVLVVTGRAESRDVPVKIRANGTVTALQSVEFRPQITSTVAQVHIREGQNVRAGELLFSLDARAEQANMQKAAAQIEKDKADLATAKRNLERQQELFRQKFISSSALDQVQNQVDTLQGQLAVDAAAAESARVARAYTEIRASFAGRTGTIPVRPGSLVQPTTPLVTVTQIDPISVSFTLPEKELAGLQQALRAGEVPVTATLEGVKDAIKGKLTFVDNSVDTTTGTIRVKAEFANGDARLWPGMYVNVELPPRVIRGAVVVPTQAVQTGPNNKFIFTVGEDKKATSRPVTLAYVEEDFAVVQGIDSGARIVIEGAQNVRTGITVTEAQREGQPPPKGEPRAKKKP